MIVAATADAGRPPAAIDSEEVGAVTTPGVIKVFDPHPHRFLARQPILNTALDVIGYELLFRSGWENFFDGEREVATRQTLDNYIFMNIESLANHGLAFVNCTRETLVGRLVTLLPPKTVVLEILESVEPDEEMVAACLQLHGMGYRIALDDFVARPEMAPLVEIASYIKVDFRLSDAAARQRIYDSMVGSHAELLAEKIETEEEFNLACAEGYKYFQGYFFCEPEIMANREIPANRVNYMRLLAELNRAEFNLIETSNIVQLEPSLCYRLLLLANSTRWHRRNDVISVQDAVMVVGEERFRAMVSVAASCVLNQEKTPALASLSLERARFCELVAPLVGQDPSEQFMLGLLSLLDATLDMPMEAIVKTLPLRAEAKAALLGEKNSVAVPLELIRGFELGAWANCEVTANVFGISEEVLARKYMEAVTWATDSMFDAVPN